jgi:hypothetical protein
MLESKKKFVRYISHEIRTPLNTVSMGVQLCMRELLESHVSGAQNILNDVEGSCNIAIEILNNILLYDKVEDGRMTLDKGDINAHEMASTVSMPFVVQVCFHVYVCMYVLCIMYVCMYVCMYIGIYVYRYAFCNFCVLIMELTIMCVCVCMCM